MGKLTKAQQTALEILGTGYVQYTVWGGNLFTSLPRGIRSRATLEALRNRGLAKCQWLGANDVRYTITPEGRQAMKGGGE